MNQTDESMKSVKATRAGRIKNSACMTPMTIAVTPIGTTSVTHQVAAKRNNASAALPSRVKIERSPLGSTASGQAGEK